MSNNAQTQTPTTTIDKTTLSTPAISSVVPGGDGPGNVSRWSHSTDSRPTADGADAKSAASGESPSGIASAASMSGTYSGQSANIARIKPAWPAKAMLVTTGKKDTTPVPTTTTDTTATATQATSGNLVDMLRGVDTELVQIMNSSGRNVQTAREESQKRP